MTTHHSGPAGHAWDVLDQVAALTPDEPHGTVGFWFIYAPMQTPFWSHYLLGCVHLRGVDGLPEPVIFEPGATHEFHLFALDPEPTPTLDDPTGWRRMAPANFIGQYRIEGDPAQADAAAAFVTDRAAWAVTANLLWAEPPLVGMTEPWHTALQNTLNHVRDGVHEVDHG